MPTTPNPVDDAITVVLTAFAKDPQVVRQILRDHADERVGGTLLGFSQRAAILAVREQSEERVWEGLLALVLQAWHPRADPRDVGFHVLPLTDAARRTGAPDELFLRAAELAPARHASELRTAIPHRGLRGALARALFSLLPWATMRPTMTPEGFSYGRPVRTLATVARVNGILAESRRRRDERR
jgi:hypothetical protein